MLDVEKIQQLVEMMVENDLIEVTLRDGEEEVKLRRPQSGAPVDGHALASVSGLGPCGSQVPGAPLPVVGTTPPSQDDQDDDELVSIPSPMVGTFYAGPDPDSPSFVQVGSPVQPGTVVCILEAMKVFNEIKAEVGGLIERILVKNADAVEYGQPLFLVRPQ